MSQLEIQSGHRPTKDITPPATWFVTRLMIVAAGILSLAPFAVGYAVH